MEDTLQEVAKFKERPIESELDKAKLLVELYLCMKPKNTPKGLPACFSIHAVSISNSICNWNHSLFFSTNTNL